MTERTEKLKAIMAANNLSAPMVGKLLNRSAATVRIWRCKDDSRDIPAMALELLEIKVAAGAHMALPARMKTSKGGEA